ncbi:hypothetical protein ACLOJK_005673 [Asimina triloba]
MHDSDDEILVLATVFVVPLGRVPSYLVVFGWGPSRATDYMMATVVPVQTSKARSLVRLYGIWRSRQEDFL